MSKTDVHIICGLGGTKGTGWSYNNIYEYIVIMKCIISLSAD